MRHAIDSRVGVALFGPSKVMSDRQRIAFQRVRSGNIAGVKLLNLIDLEDPGTKANILLGFGKMDAERACTTIVMCFQRMSNIIMFTEPDLGITASPFLEKMGTRLQQIFRSCVEITYGSSYYFAIITRVTQPTRRYFKGDDGSHLPVFNKAWIDEMTEERQELLDAQQEAAGERAVRRFQGAKREGDDPYRPTGKTKKQKRKEREEQEAKKASLVQRASSVAAGTAVPVPRKDGKPDAAKVKEWQESAGLQKKNGKWPCWGFFHPQGCTQGDKCKFHHQE